MTEIPEEEWQKLQELATRFPKGQEGVMTEPRKSRAYHISQDAIDICNRLDLDPSEAVLYLNAEVDKRSAFIDVKKAMREVMQVEGVTLRVADKEMLEKAFNAVISEIQKAKVDL
jgi:hypothetical protein